ncbi:M61 family metallopeptidase [Paludibacterium purpuratum]|uniref:Putative metalloprotease with PDZ domain n=1 Tax=Paludibacterium purpuratum TaxID=1144873 RepID=A0A4R7BFB0_9NEIS|nr:PDZ domain-containing protein [Paludibacterium purpuratum]TDR82735.1 putative metalloprotease with PDZ domain [Paludibacterium purpuratum]
MSVPVLYRIRPASPEAHLFEVSLTVAQPAKKGQMFHLPAWIPGSYMIREFARHIVSLRAECSGRPVAVQKLDKHSWQADPVDGVLTLHYQVYAFDLSVRGAYLDKQRGFFNGTSVFLAVEGYEQTACDVEIEAPKGKHYQDWRVATSLPVRPDKQKGRGFGRYRAENYDELIDHPVELGAFESVSFKACGVPHEFVVSGLFRADLKRLARDAKKICEWHIRLFGEPAPFDRYVFMLFAGKDIYGGLEHRSSTALMCDRDDLPLPGAKQISDGYMRLLGLISHEYFHAWNVKRLKPAVFQPYDLAREGHTHLLWAFEGITSYYDDLALLRAGLIDRERYLGQLAETISGVMRGNGRTKQTLEESSFDAWIKYYRQDENSPNSIVSYYAKGALVALSLDLLIRDKTRGAKSLDDVMRFLWKKWQKDGAGLAEDEWESLAIDATGLDLRDFFDRALRSTEDLPLAALLATQGIKLDYDLAASAGDRGGFGALKPAPESPRATLGVKASTDVLGVRLQQVFDGGAAQAAGLSGGDVIVAVDGLRVADPEKMQARLMPGQSATVHAFRRDELMTLQVLPQAQAPDACRLSQMKKTGRWPAD